MFDPPALAHEFMHIHIRAYAYTLTCRQSIVEYMLPNDRLRKKQILMYVRKNCRVTATIFERDTVDST